MILHFFLLLLDLLQAIAKIHRLATHNFQEVPSVICRRGSHKDGDIHADDTGMIRSLMHEYTCVSMHCACIFLDHSHILSIDSSG